MYFVYMTRSKSLSARRFSLQSVKDAPQFFRYSACKKFTLRYTSYARVSKRMFQDTRKARYFLHLEMWASTAFDAVFGQMASFLEKTAQFGWKARKRPFFEHERTSVHPKKSRCNFFGTPILLGHCNCLFWSSKNGDIWMKSGDKAIRLIARFVKNGDICSKTRKSQFSEHARTWRTQREENWLWRSI